MKHPNVGIMSQNVKNLNLTSVSNGNQESLVSQASNQASGVDSYSFMCEDTNIKTVPGVGSAPMVASKGSIECPSDEMYDHHHENRLQELGKGQCDMISKPVPKKRGRKKKLPGVASGGMLLTKIISHE